MPLESCMLVLDNSEYMRNGDYAPTRFQSQAEAVSTVFTAKTDANPESAVGLMTMAGKAPSLLVTPTNDLGKLLSSLNKTVIGGTIDLSTSISIAQLALKHRENKNQRQRIVVFVGSPIEETQDALVKLGKKLRKNNVVVDIVTFGDEGRENDEKFQALVDAVGPEESHLVSIPPGPHFLSDIIASSPILFDGQGPVPGASGDGFGDDGVDPNMDPELAMAIRMSLQEAQNAAGAGQSTSADAGPSVPAPAAPAPVAAEPETANATTLPDSMTKPLSNANDPDIPMVTGDEDEDEDEDEELRRAMALSRGEDVEMQEGVEGEDDDEEYDEDAAIAAAIAKSLEKNEDEDK